MPCKTLRNFPLLKNCSRIAAPCCLSTGCVILLTICTGRIHRADGWYADESGGDASAWIGIELMAQAIAVHVALDKRRYGLPVKMGALLGTRSYRPSQPVFVVAQPLLIRAKMRCYAMKVAWGLTIAVLKVQGNALHWQH